MTQDDFTPQGFAPARQGAWRAILRDALSPDDVFRALAEAGEPLKRSRKSTVRKVGPWVVKRAAGGTLTRFLRLSLQRARHRQAWIAAMRLRRAGVLIPEPLAFVERRRLGIITDNAMISAYLDGFRNVEHFLKAMVECGAGADAVQDFFARLARAVNQLADAGAYHADLSGKNIFTRDGTQFVFIDLDAVSFDGDYDDARRLKNHIQIYDSFCDFVADRALVPLIQAMLSPNHDLRVWMPRVRKGQAERRARIEAKWARQGKL
jgi:hypothetical protein